MNNDLKKFLLIFGDLATMYFSLFLTLLLRYREIPNEELWQIHLWPFTAIFFFWLVIFYVCELYALHTAVNNSRLWGNIFRGFIASSLVSVLFFYFLPLAKITPKINLAIFIGVFLFIFSFWRHIFNWLAASYLPRNNVAIIGRNRLVDELLSEFRNKPHLGLAIPFIIDEIATEKETQGTPIFSNLNDLPELIKKKNVSQVILAQNPDSEKLRTLLFECLPLKITFTSLVEFYENVTGKVPIETIGKMWFLENLSEGNKAAFDSLKRFFDTALALVILMLTLPFWPIIALIIKLESKGPILFKQTRAGQNGIDFKILKFRTMRTENNDSSPTKDGDKRITGFGNFMRKTRIDELPQMINIIKGEMSFVGPRPERPELIIELEKQIPFYRERMLVKPGITGVDQTSGEYHSPSYEDTMKKLQYDLFYIKNRSLYLDIAVLLKTIRTVISKGGK
jgi:exopolysaccharide biosynthesis polyprenyl glycosylphosphotransferase